MYQKRWHQKTIEFSLASVLVLTALSAVADDTDIYLRNFGATNAPYVMITLDYRQDLSGPYCKDSGPSSGRCINLLNTPETFVFLQSLDVVVNGEPQNAQDGDSDGDGLRDSVADMTNFSASKLQALVAVARVAFEDIGNVNVGLMISNNDGGGTILRGYKPFLLGDSNNAKQELIDILLSLPMPTQGNQYHESQPKELHYEWFRYINGGDVIFGNQTAGNFDGTNMPTPDPTIFSGNRYISPFTATPSNFECTKFYEIYATSGNEPGTDSDLTNEITNDFGAAAAAKYENMVAYLSNNDILTATNGDQTLKSFFIQIGNSAAMADDWAVAAGTDDQYMVVSGTGTDLINIHGTINDVLVEATSTSSTFVAASVPVNIFNRTNTLDNLFVAFFEPQATERWPGNIKKYKLKDNDVDGDFDEIIDVNDVIAFDSNDGQVKPTALSFWTNKNALPPADLSRGEVELRDGRSVTRGGAGQKIPGFIAGNVGASNAEGLRQIFVEPSSGTVLDAFDADNNTAVELQGLLGAADPASALELIRWARGIDVDDEDGDASTTDSRRWLFGDVIHSRPLPINYGGVGDFTQNNPHIRLFFGTNQGFFHILENTDKAGVETGRELFSFIPRELLGNLSGLRSNSGASSYPSSSSAHPYGLDGEPAALVVDKNGDAEINANDNDEAYVYTGMRRGGKSYYAFDVSDYTKTPELLWKITKTNGGDFDELGYTFSTPKVVRVQYENSARDVLIFAGGFDLNKDDSAGTIARGPDSEGNAIYIVDARTGNLIWKVKGGSGINSNTVLHEAELTHSIPSSVATLDSNGNGTVDRLYVGDTGSVVWRVDLPEGNGTDHRKDNWTITKLGNFFNPSGREDRRFFHPPDIVQTKDASGKYDGILIATGDRANPTETRDSNFIYFIKDRNIISGDPPAPSLPASLGVVTDNDLVDTTACITIACAMLDYANGWKIKLTGSGEKALASPIVADGKVFLTTYLPTTANSGSCAPPEGSGQLYIANLSDGTAAFGETRNYALGGGIPPSVTAIDDKTLVIPSTGIINPLENSPNKQKVIEIGGKSVFIIYWREAGKDVL